MGVGPCVGVASVRMWILDADVHMSPQMCVDVGVGCTHVTIGLCHPFFWWCLCPERVGPITTFCVFCEPPFCFVCDRVDTTDKGSSSAGTATTFVVLQGEVVGGGCKLVGWPQSLPLRVVCRGGALLQLATCPAV